jgi:glycosyltransferase involved in cell wall biosynthesis
VNARLSVIIPCKNERSNIRGCVESVRGIADEIIVADSGSTDGTLDVVRQMGGCRTIEREWIGYASFKNWAIPQARHPWVLLVDADERVTPQLAEEIRRTLDSVGDQMDGFRIPRQNYFLGQPIRHSGWRGDAVCRLIRRDRCRYREVLVHEEIDIAPQRCGRLKQAMLHYTHASYDQYLEKTILYTALSARDSYRSGRRPSYLRLLLVPPVRFLKCYFVKGGLLDGAAGLQVCMMTAFYAFLKEARLWELHRVAQTRRCPDVAGDQGAAAADGGRATASDGESATKRVA